MSLRLIEIVLPQENAAAIGELPSADQMLGRWDDWIGDDQLLSRILVNTEQTEALLDDLEKQFSAVDGFRVMLLPVEATIPRPSKTEADKSTAEKKVPQRISRQELYDDISAGSDLSRVFTAQVILATLVAAVGLIRNDMAVIIGAMVIAPLLGPNVALCLATTLGDAGLGVRALKTNVIGITIALVCSLVIGTVFEIDPGNPAIQSRTQVSAGDIILALASGCAGVLAFTTGAPAALIGVMVAVALLPPTVVLGLLFASGELNAAAGAVLLVATNVICVNLAGVLTFLVQGVRPRNWWEAERARNATRIAIVTWTLLLVILAGLIALATRT